MCVCVPLVKLGFHLFYYPYFNSMTSLVTRFQIYCMPHLFQVLKVLNLLEPEDPKQSRGHITINLIYPPLMSQSQTALVGKFWNGQSAVKKVDFISAFQLLFWLSGTNWKKSVSGYRYPTKNSATPLFFFVYAFSQTPQETGRVVQVCCCVKVGALLPFLSLMSTYHPLNYM